MTRTGIGALIALAVPVLAAPVHAQLARTVRTTGSASIQQPATLSASRDLDFAIAAASVAVVPAIAAAPSTAPGASNGSRARPVSAATALRSAPSVGSIVPAQAQATFIVAGDSGQAISVVVPAAVALSRDGGTETAFLTTSDSLGDGPQFLGGDFRSAGTLSFNVGGQVVLASANVTAGTYDGVLAVVAQYN